MTPYDVVVAGAGPAGLSAAAACAAGGLHTVLVAPSARVWAPTYCLWADQLDAAAGPAPATTTSGAGGTAADDHTPDPGAMPGAQPGSPST